MVKLLHREILQIDYTQKIYAVCYFYIKMHLQYYNINNIWHLIIRACSRVNWQGPMNNTNIVYIFKSYEQSQKVCVPLVTLKCCLKCVGEDSATPIQRIIGTGVHGEWQCPLEDNKGTPADEYNSDIQESLLFPTGVFKRCLMSLHLN